MISKNTTKRTIALNKVVVLFFITVINLISLSGCKTAAQTNRIVIWTNSSEFAQYAELFNKTHKTDSATIVYKENPALSLPPAKDELPPDIIVGSWLNADQTQKYFKSLDYLFDHKKLTSDMFYTKLLDAGKGNYSQILLPVSFNLPAVIFDKKNSSLISENYTMSLEQVRNIAASYNQKKKNGNFTKIGFAPLSNEDFLYLSVKMSGADFRDEKGKILWNDSVLKTSTDFLKDWITKENVSAQTEEDFAFKYLSMPYYRQVSSDRTLFAYATSDVLFRTMKDQHVPIDYRWLGQNSSILMEDDFTMMGIYNGAGNQVGASEFITWFFQAETQRKLLERKESLNLDMATFGIAGGFSALRDITEHTLPVYYTELLSNIPPANMISVPNKLPARWESYKSLVVLPYIKNAITADEGTAAPDMNELEQQWRKKVFD